MLDHMAIDDEMMVGMKRHFDDGEIVELGMFVASHVGVGRLLAILDAD